MSSPSVIGPGKGLLTEKDVGALLEVTIYECSLGGVTCCRIGLRRAMCWRSSVMRFSGSTGSGAGASSSPGILKASPYTTSATDACRSSLNVVRIPRRTRVAPQSTVCPRGTLLLLLVSAESVAQDR